MFSTGVGGGGGGEQGVRAHKGESQVEEEEKQEEGRTLFVELVGGVLGAHAVKHALRRVAVGAVALAEDHDGVVVDQLLGLDLGGFHGGGGRW